MLIAIAILLALLGARPLAAQRDTLPAHGYALQVETSDRWLHGRQQPGFTPFRRVRRWIYIDSLPTPSGEDRTLLLTFQAFSGLNATAHLGVAPTGRVLRTDVVWPSPRLSPYQTSADSVRVVHLSGRLDWVTAGAFRDCMRDDWRDDLLIVDLSRMSGVDSAGTGVVLAAAARDFKSKRGPRFARPRGAFREKANQRFGFFFFFDAFFAVFLVFLATFFAFAAFFGATFLATFFAAFLAAFRFFAGFGASTGSGIAGVASVISLMGVSSISSPNVSTNAGR